MKNRPREEAGSRLILWAETAADLMTPNPVSIGADASVKEAAAFLADKGFSAAPVIDAGGRTVGVVSQADIVIHDREKVDYLPTNFDRRVPATSAGEALGSGFQVENVDRTRVRDIMTPAVFSVAPNTPVRKVVEQILALKIHRLFVIGKDGVLVGVISTLDVLRYLRPEQWKDPAESESPSLCLQHS
jgi:CBS domain-containing protein